VAAVLSPTASGLARAASIAPGVSIERLYPDRLAEQVERLAHHAFRGELWERAVGFLRQAGAKAAAWSAYREAVAGFEQALVALRHLPDTSVTLEQGIDLRFDLRRALQPLGEHERTIERLREAETVATVLGDQDRLAWASAYLSQYLWWMGDPAPAEELGQRALTIASALGDFPLQVVANFFLGQGYFNVGDYRRAIDHCRRNVAVLEGERAYERLGLTGLPSVLSRAWLAQSLAERGEFAEAMAHAEGAVSIAEAAGQPYSIAEACNGVGRVHLVRGALAQSISLLERAAGLCKTWNLRLVPPGTAPSLGSAYALCGRVAEALPVLEQAAAQEVTSGLFFQTLTTTTALGSGYLLAGRMDEAVGLTSRAAELAAERGFRASHARALWLLGEIGARRDPPEVAQAEDHYRRALALADELGMRPLAAHCHLGLGKLYRGTADGAKAREPLTTAATMYREMEMRFWLAQAEAALREGATSPQSGHSAAG